VKAQFDRPAFFHNVKIRFRLRKLVFFVGRELDAMSFGHNGCLVEVNRTTRPGAAG
jgi:hypothetical protein